jgi:hypothetical protein
MSEFEHKDIWTKQCEDFTIEVSKHEWPAHNIAPGWDMGPNRWCLYVYIYPKHPFFKECVVEGKYGTDQRVANYLPFHMGCTFFHAHRDNLGEITSYQFGADYSHYHDEWITHLATKEDARVVFMNAEELERYVREGKLT